MPALILMEVNILKLLTGAPYIAQFIKLRIEKTQAFIITDFFENMRFEV